MGDKIRDKEIEDIIKDLQLKLAEKDEIIRAIQNGEVDVLVKKNPENKINIIPLKGAELTYQILIESMNEGAVTFIKDGTIVYCNKKFSEFVKLPPEKIINTKIFNYIELNKSKSAILKELSKNNIKEIFLLKAHDNTTKTVIFSCKQLQLNKVSATTIVVTDLSEIQEAEQRYSTLVDNASCGIIIYDFNGVVIEANKQAEKILGRTKKQMIGYDLRNFMPMSEQEYATTQLKKLINTNIVGPNDAHWLRPNGEIRDIIYTATHMMFGDKKLLLGIFNDVTENNRLRSQALLNDKLASVGTIATGIVHEINNPLTWLTSNLVYLKEKLKNLKSSDINQEKQRLKFEEVIDESIEGSNKIKEIIQDLKGFSRIDDKHLEPVDINKILDSAIKMTNFQFKNRIQINKDFDSNIPSLLLNKNKLHQVALNLIINATQSMDENKKNNTILVKSYLRNSHVCIDVADTGKGIAPEILPRIFEPFFTTKPAGEGTGLGLSLCYDILKSLGGSIDVKSELGIGSIFTVSLPVHADYQKTPERKKLKETDAGKKILVIYDDRYISNKINESLKNYYDLTIIQNARNALQTLVKKPDQFDLIICNFETPDIDGKDLYEFTASHNSKQRFIFTTDALKSKVISNFSKNKKNITFIKNNFLPNQLLNAVDKMLIQQY